MILRSPLFANDAFLVCVDKCVKIVDRSLDFFSGVGFTNGARFWILADGRHRRDDVAAG